MNILIAWSIYFIAWGLAITRGEQLSKSKIIVIVMGIISLGDIVYIGMHDLRGLILVILATVFAVAGVANQIMKSNI